MRAIAKHCLSLTATKQAEQAEQALLIFFSVSYKCQELSFFLLSLRPTDIGHIY